MNGLDLSQAFFEEYGKPMLEEQFPELLSYLAVGLFGSGSECFGYDDTVSQDHDFEPGFCVFLPGEELVDRRSAFLLERAYAKLPKCFRGIQRSRVLPVGGARHGVFRTSEYYEKTVGVRDGVLDTQQWLTIPEQALAEATNGRLFFDNWGEVSWIRQRLSYFPEDIRLKRLAGQLLLMAQSGQYNYLRCLKHGESAAAQMAVYEFVKSCMTAVFLLNRRYQPYYKWSFRALRELPLLGSLAVSLEVLMTTGNNPDYQNEKEEQIETLASEVADALRKENLTPLTGNDLERLAYSVNSRIQNPELRNMHILAGI